MEQDWETVTFKAKKPKNTPAGLAKARQQGLAVETTKKFNAGGNKQKAAPVDSVRLAGPTSIDEDAEQLSVPTVSRDQARAIQQGRTAKGLTQKELATRLNITATQLAEYEQGKAIPNNQVLGKLERTLGVKLRGKDIGAKLEPKGKGQGKTQAKAQGKGQGKGQGKTQSKKKQQ